LTLYPFLILTADNEKDAMVIDYDCKEDNPWRDDGQPTKGKKLEVLFMTLEITGIAGLYNALISSYKTMGSIDLDDIIDQCVFYLHQRRLYGCLL
jgi:hypothetical protein